MPSSELDRRQALQSQLVLSQPPGMEAVTYLQLSSGAPLPPLSGQRPFRAIILIEQSVTSSWQSIVSDWLVQSGCLFMMAWGIDCSSWDDSVDCANLSAFNFGEIPDESLVMTTWHEGETISEVLWFAKNHARHPAVTLEHTVIIHVAANERKAELLLEYQAANETAF